jgi:transcriptional regulator with XRE-family HTH domain
MLYNADNMKIESTQTDEAVLGELARRIARIRLERNLTQAQVATKAGIARATLQRLEAGESTDLSTFIRVLRALDLLPGLEVALPGPSPSPIERLRMLRRQRQRARPKPEGAATTPRAEPWRWADESSGAEAT